MSDQRLRELEQRFQQTGAIEDEIALVRERKKRGIICANQLVVAAKYGSEVARAIVGPDFSRMGNYADFDFSRWVFESFYDGYRWVIRSSLVFIGEAFLVMDESLSKVRRIKNGASALLINFSDSRSQNELIAKAFHLFCFRYSTRNLTRRESRILKLITGLFEAYRSNNYLEFNVLARQSVRILMSELKYKEGVAEDLLYYHVKEYNVKCALGHMTTEEIARHYFSV